MSDANREVEYGVWITELDGTAGRWLSDHNNNRPIWRGSQSEAGLFAEERRAVYRNLIYAVRPLAKQDREVEFHTPCADDPSMPPLPPALLDVIRSFDGKRATVREAMSAFKAAEPGCTVYDLDDVIGIGIGERVEIAPGHTLHKHNYEAIRMRPASMHNTELHVRRDDETNGIRFEISPNGMSGRFIVIDRDSARAVANELLELVGDAAKFGASATSSCGFSGVADLGCNSSHFGAGAGGGTGEIAGIGGCGSLGEVINGEYVGGGGAGS